MEKLSKHQTVFLCLDFLFVGFSLPLSIGFMLRGDYVDMLGCSFIGFIYAIFAMIKLDKFTGHGKYNTEFFSQHVF